MKLTVSFFLGIILFIAFSCGSKKILSDQDEQVNLNGEKLFYTNCSSCHHHNMVENLSGPALGRITQRRSKKWIYDFTRNSGKMIAAGDKDAIEIYNKYNPMVMGSFEFLTDKELTDIYEYVEEVYRKNKK